MVPLNSLLGCHEVEARKLYIGYSSNLKQRLTDHLPIQVTPVADADDDGDKLPVTDSVDYPVGSDAVQIVNTGQLLNAVRPRVVFQRLKPADNAP